MELLNLYLRSHSLPMCLVIRMVRCLICSEGETQIAKLGVKKSEFNLMDTIIRLNKPYSLVCDIEIKNSS